MNSFSAFPHNQTQQFLSLSLSFWFVYVAAAGEMVERWSGVFNLDGTKIKNK